jgi:hypothetical protein
MNQMHTNNDELRVHAFNIDRDQIIEVDSNNSNEDLDNSKITLFTHEGGDENDYKYKRNSDELEQKMQLGGGGILITESNYDSNNYQYSESEFNQQHGSSSIGAILQCFGNGSFIGSSKNNGGAFGQGRDSVTTPFAYDENSLMNLSNTPSMMRTSRLTRKQDERIISSTKLNAKHNSVMC